MVGMREEDTHIVEPGKPLGLARGVTGLREDSGGIDRDGRNADPSGIAVRMLCT